jgi:hypothetical protein
VGKIDENVIFGGLDKQGRPYGDVFPALLSKVTTPTNVPRFEFVRLVSGLPSKGFYPFPLSPENPGFPQFNWLFADMLFATEVRADIERKAGGSVGQNLDHLYRLSDGEKGYLQSIGLPGRPR